MSAPSSFFLFCTALAALILAVLGGTTIVVVTASPGSVVNFTAEVAGMTRLDPAQCWSASACSGTNPAPRCRLLRFAMLDASLPPPLVAANATTTPPWLAELERGGSCCVILAENLRLRRGHTLHVHPANQAGIGPDALLDIFRDAAGRWDAQMPLLQPFVRNVRLLSPGKVAVPVQRNHRDEIHFGEIVGLPPSVPASSVIAFTSLWIHCKDFDQRSNRCVDPRPEIIESDQLYNEAHFVFAANARGRQQVIDLPSVVTHEMGHLFGIGHPPREQSTKCGKMTMWHSILFDETHKRSLHIYDATCLRALYETSAARTQHFRWTWQVCAATLLVALLLV